MYSITKFAIILGNLAFQSYSQISYCYNPITTCFDPSITPDLLFQKSQYTTCSRVIPITQLNCVNGQSTETKDLCGLYSKYITSIKCENSGLDDSSNVIWNCEGNLPSNVIFGTNTVSCEGCKSSTDNLKILGSCGIYYSLVLTNDGNEPLHNTNVNMHSNHNYIKLFLVVLILSIIACCIGALLYNLCSFGNRNRRRDYTRINTNFDNTTNTSNMVFHEAIPLVQTNVNTISSALSVPSAPSASSIHQVQPVQTYVPFINYKSPQQYSNSHSNSHTQRHTYEQYQSNNQENGFLSGYLLGENLKKGNVESAMMISSFGGNRNNCYNNGLMMGMIAGEIHKNNKHHNKHNIPNVSNASGSNNNNSTFHKVSEYSNTSTR